MGFDLFQSRRNYNERCKWWSRNEAEENTPDELIMKRVPSGQFYAKEMNAEQLMKLNLGGVFRIDSTHVTIKSPDDLDNIKGDDIVLYQGEKWMVVSVQKTKAKLQQTEFAADKNCSHFWYIELRK